MKKIQIFFLLIIFLGSGCASMRSPESTASANAAYGVQSLPKNRSKKPKKSKTVKYSKKFKVKEEKKNTRESWVPKKRNWAS